MKSIKQAVLIAIFSGMVMNLLAQPPKRTTAWNYYKEKQYAKALEAINEAAQNELTINDYKTWYFRALIIHDIVITNDSVTKLLLDDPMTECYKSAQKSMSLDLKKVYFEENKIILKDIVLFIFNTGVEKFNLGVQTYTTDEANSKINFTKALKRFDQYFEIMKLMGKDSMATIMELTQYKIDYKDIYYYAATSANMIGLTNKAKNLLNGLVAVKYSGYSAYISLADIYIAEGDTVKAIQAIESGKKYVTDKEDLKQINLKELQIYQQMGRMEELRIKLEKALAADPGNPNLLITLGESYYTISEKMYEEKKYTEAEEYRNKAIELYLQSITLLKPTDTELSFLLNNKIGTIYYNVGVDYYNLFVEEDKKKDKNEKVLKDHEIKYWENFDKAIPYLEKSMEIKPDDKSAIPLLIKIYLLKGNMEKVGELNKLK